MLVKNWTQTNSGLLVVVLFLAGSLSILAQSEAEEFQGPPSGAAANRALPTTDERDSTAPTPVATMATYIGCFMDQAAHDLSGKSVAAAPDMTVAACQNACAGFTYAGLQNGSACSCGNSYGKYGAAPSSQCNVKCSGNASAICGGVLRNSIYKIN